MELIEYRRVSVNVSKILKEKYGTDEEIDFKKRLNNIYLKHSVKRGNKYVSMVYTGSIVEGTAIDGSDADMMGVSNEIKVIDHNAVFVPTKNEHITLRIEYDIGSPGHALLKLCDPNDLFYGLFINSCIRYNQKIILSSSLVLDIFVENGFHVQGPCLNLDSRPGSGLDSVFFAIKYNSWPMIALEWLHRRRKYGWPCKSLIRDILKDGCFLVPVGDGVSDKSLIHWRISFVISEIKLVHAFTRVQHDVYILLKIVLKENLQKYWDRDEPLISSYTMKTIVFHAIENSPTTFWMTENLFLCFWMCFNLLISCISKGFLPHYFIPNNNIIRKLIRRKERCEFLQVLLRYRQHPLRILTECPTLQCLHPHRSNEAFIFDLREVTVDKFMFSYVSMNRFSSLSCLPMHATLSYLLNSRNDADAFIALEGIRCVIEAGFSELITITECESNIHIYSKRRTLQHYLLFLSHLDVSRGWLTLATFFYITGNYNKALNTCQIVSKSYSPWSLFEGIDSLADAYRKNICLQELSITSKIKKASLRPFTIHKIDNVECFAEYVDVPLTASLAINDPVGFLNVMKKSARVLSKHLRQTNNHYICPPEILPELDLFEDLTLTIPQYAYIAFLTFLCAHRMRDVHLTSAAFSELKSVMHDEVQGVKRYPVLYSLVGICYEMSGELQHANISFSIIRKLKPKDKAASWRIEHFSRMENGLRQCGHEVFVKLRNNRDIDFSVFQSLCETRLSIPVFSVFGAILELNGDYEAAELAYTFLLSKYGDNGVVTRRLSSLLDKREGRVSTATTAMGELTEMVSIFNDITSSCPSMSKLYTVFLNHISRA